MSDERKWVSRPAGREGKRLVRITDTTLRDGEQTAGVVFTLAQKVEIARRLDRIGVHQIEVGTPAMGGEEAEAVAEIAALGLKAAVQAWNRASVSDLEASIACGVDSVAISLATSDLHMATKLRRDREWVLRSMSEAVAFAKSKGLYVVVGAEDASRTDFDFLVEYANAAEAQGADRLRFCDTVGVMEPFGTYRWIQSLFERTNLEVEIHVHNDFGLAAANTLAAVRAGATWAGVTAGGIGERAGNAALEEVVMALEYIEGCDTGVTTAGLTSLVEHVSRAAGRELPGWKPIVGADIFAHESGIHADGVIKNPDTYEAFAPEVVGLERRIIIGKHSGSRAVQTRLELLGVRVDRDHAQAMVPAIRAKAIELHRSLTDAELLELADAHTKAGLG